MKKLLIALALSLVLALCGLSACATPESEPDPTPTTYTVAFEVDGGRYLTKRVEKGGSITDTVADPVKTGYTFDFWTLDGAEVDIYAYVVNSDVTFAAQFTADSSGSEDQGETDDTNYFNVYIQVNGSYLTRTEAETFEERFKATLSAENSALTVFHIEEGDSSAFKTLIQGATDVDAVIGGNSPLKDFDYNTDYYNTEGAALMNVASGHFASTNRKIIIMANSNSMELAVVLYTFATTPYVVSDINITVTVHGDTDAVTVLTDSETVIDMPEITVGENELFKGFATVANGLPVLTVAKDALLKYDDIKTLLEEEATSLDLYPIIEDKPAERAHYVKIAWYDNSNSGLTETIIGEIETALKAFLADEGVSAEDIATIEFKAYSGKVGPATTDINNDGDVDIMIGFGSAENITTTGNINAESIVESIGGFTMGDKTKYVHVLSEDASVVKTMEFIRSADLTDFKAPAAE